MADQPIIIIKKIKKVAGGHHGGAWKVAYADFVTAMMAFFLLLWLLNVTTDVERKGIADYFAPSSISKSEGGAGGLFGGRTMSAPEAKFSNSAPPGIEDAEPLPPGYESEAKQVEDAGRTGSAGDDREGKQAAGQADSMFGGRVTSAPSTNFADSSSPGIDEKQPRAPGYEAKADENAEAGRMGAPGEQEKGRGGDAAGKREGGRGDVLGSATEGQDKASLGAGNRQPDRGEIAQSPKELSKEALQQQMEKNPALVDEAVKKRTAEEAKVFAGAADMLKTAIEKNPDLKGLSASLMIDQTEEGLRIQIVDQEKLSMFPSGSAQMYPQTRELLELIGKAVSKLPNKLALTGHTDSMPFSANSTRDNWDLSAERANASRRVLIATGITPDRIQTVVGRADRDPLIENEPANPKNRRISIVLLRQANAPLPAVAMPEGASAEPAPAAEPETPPTPDSAAPAGTPLGSPLGNPSGTP